MVHMTPLNTMYYIEHNTSTILDIKLFNVNTYTYFMIRVLFYTMYPLFLTLELKVDNRKKWEPKFPPVPIVNYCSH